MNTRTFFGAAIGVILLVNQHVVKSSSVCDSPKCIEEAAYILEYVDPKANPCEDFHQFTCGTFMENAHGNKTYELKNRIMSETLNELIGLYQEDIRETDHKMVKFAKKMYQACLDQAEVEKDLKTVKAVLKNLGGWPVLEGSNWNEDDFDWLNLTLALRRLGYDYNALLSVNVLSDPDNKNKYILKVDGGYNDFVPIEILNDISQVAVLFRATNESSKEFTDVYEFMQKLSEVPRIEISDEQEIYSTLQMYERKTVEEIEKAEAMIDWLAIINNITYPIVEITKDDHIMFPKQHYLKRVFELIALTPKRTVANYMFWTAVKPLVRFLPNCPGSSRICKLGLERPMICLGENYVKLATQSPNPIEVIRLRQYLSEDKRKKIENLVANIQTSFLDYVSKSQWIAENNKMKTVNTVKGTKVVVGMSGNYFDDKVLDDSDIDMAELEGNSTSTPRPTDLDMRIQLAQLHGFQVPGQQVEKKVSFFTLLAQAERNLQSSKYIKVNNPVPKYHHTEIFTVTFSEDYPTKAHTLYIPLSATKSFFYDENRPEYLNYGTLGTFVAYEFTKMLDNLSTISAYRDIKDCLEKEMESGITNNYENDFEMMDILRGAIAEHVSYSAYEEWEKSNGVEQKLISTQYTPKQLFWLSVGSLKCQPVLTERYRVSSSVRQNPSFATDFNCPVNSKLNPTKRCNII